VIEVPVELDATVPIVGALGAVAVALPYPVYPAEAKLLCPATDGDVESAFENLPPINSASTAIIAIRPKRFTSVGTLSVDVDTFDVDVLMSVDISLLIVWYFKLLLKD
jgi:hypothetical protein